MSLVELPNLILPDSLAKLGHFMQYIFNEDTTCIHQRSNTEDLPTMPQKEERQVTPIQENQYYYTIDQ
jgi:hypothetical protein